ncbi:hypothetical protein PTKIN_Ptkin06aG0143800 [Pterospermum kingtungense]
MDDAASIFVQPLLSNILDTVGSLIKEGFLAIQGVRKEVEKLSSNLTTIRTVLKDAEERQLEEPHVKDWLVKLKNAACDIEDILDTYATETFLWKKKQQVRNFRPPFSLSKACFESDVAHRIKEVSAELAAIAEEKNKFHLNITSDCGRSQNLPCTTFFTSTIDVFGRESDKETLINMMLSKEFNMDGDVSVIPIVGMGGLGKTTLAQLIFHDERVKNHFEFRMWVCVTAKFNYRRILEEMIKFHTELEYSKNLDIGRLEARFLSFSAGKSFLLVLDDVWTDDYQQWEPLQNLLKQGGQSSRVLVTTRTTKVSDIMGTQPPYRLQYLPEDVCWSLFKKIAFKDRGTHEELEKIGGEIVKKCNGLPLAVKAMGGLLRGNVDVNKWKKILRHNISELEEGNFDRPRILPALKLSYDHLPSNLKQCFAYCSLFPKAYVFDRKELVKLWMAQSFIQSSSEQSLEEAGIEYFDELLTRSFFQILNINNRVGYIMHDLIHDLALSVSSPQCSQVEYGKSGIFCGESRHVSFHCEHLENSILQIVENSKKLRTFLLHGEYLKDLGRALEKLFHSVKYIRVLDLSFINLVELPSSVDELKLLRYLNLSKTLIKSLPNSICNLYNLQTLKLLGCHWLCELPKDLGNLVNLKYLELDEIFWFNCRMLPSKMGNLTTLKKLNTFLVSDTSGHGIAKPEEVAYLTALHMLKLENVVNAADSKLQQKESLQKQVLDRSGRDFNEQDEVKAEMELKDLTSQTNLEDLAIHHFIGSNFPAWMTDGLLQNLVTLFLNHCTKCKILSLGQLPFLRDFYIKGMLELEEWPEDQYTSLCTLHIINCPKLRKVPNFMSNLRVLKVKKCNSLKALPVAPSLLFLILINNPVLEDRQEGSCIPLYDQGNLVGQPRPAFVGPLELKLENCPKIQALPRLCAPQKLEISGCELVSAFSVPELAQHLQHLAVDTCSSVTLVRAIPSTNSLHSLVISNISDLISFPKLPHLPGLKALYISDCKCLTSLSEAKGSFRSLSSLQLLSIQGCPNLQSLPDENFPTALECLMIGSCPLLKSLGAKETLKSLVFLKDLYIEDCPSIKCFPEEGLPPSLHHLKIHGCPLLIDECQKEDAGATEWPKIMYVPDLEIDSIKLSSTQLRQRTKNGFFDLFALKAYTGSPYLGDYKHKIRIESHEVRDLITNYLTD